MRLSVGSVAAALCIAGAVAGCEDPGGPDQQLAPARFITAKRAWLPGERDSVIARIVSNRSFAGIPYVGDLTDFAADILADPDSVTVIVPNPLYAPAANSAMNFRLMPPDDATWSVTGLMVVIFDQSITPRDTLSWVGAFWYKIGEETWKGFIVAASTDSVYPARAVRTNTFDAGGGKSGAGGGEVRVSTGEYWEANGSGTPHTIQIDSANYGAYSSIPSGVFKGGDRRTGTVKGLISNVRMPRVLPSASGFINVDLDFRTTAIPAVGILCTFPVPCIGEAAVRTRSRP